VVQALATFAPFLLGAIAVAWNQGGAALTRRRARSSARKALVKEVDLEIDHIGGLAVEFDENAYGRIQRGEAFLFANNPAPSHVFELQGPILATLPLEEAVAVAAYRRSFGTLNALLDTMETATYTAFERSRRLRYLRLANDQVEKTLQNALSLQFQLKPERSKIKWTNRWRTLIFVPPRDDQLSPTAAQDMIKCLINKARHERALQAQTEPRTAGQNT
jgi:hypothetical protein